MIIIFLTRTYAVMRKGNSKKEEMKAANNKQPCSSYPGAFARNKGTNVRYNNMKDWVKLCV
jgi:hypothetical protein